MKIPLMSAYVFWVPWWGEEHRADGCPVQVTVHTRRSCLMVRPLGTLTQGGDIRGRTDLDGYYRMARWVLRDQDPQVWDSIRARRRRRRRR